MKYSLLVASLFLLELTIAEYEIPAVEVSDAGDEGFFSDQWRKEYTEEKLARQPRWKLTDDQPRSGEYEVREYAPAWWVTSYSPCLNQTVAAQFGYLKLYLYMNKYNGQKVEYNLTYPIINKIEIAAERPDPEGKDTRIACPDRYSVNLYLPHPVGDDDPVNDPAESIDETTMTSEDHIARRRFVKRYEDTFTAESNDVCNYQAGLLATNLALDGQKFNPSTYYCALYEPGQSGNHGFEVWFDENMQ